MFAGRLAPVTRPQFRSAHELLDAYRFDEVSPVEVIDATLRSISDSTINAFWRVDADRAASAARYAEDAYRRGTPRPLEGVPIGVKDIIDTAGMTTTSGSSMFADRVPDADADVVQALREAGAIIVGKTATHEFAYGVTTVNPRYGTTHHPSSPGHIVGGSSGGSAAAVTDGLVPLALGSDTSVSIREPSAFCGCVGLRPTHDSISLRGVTPLAPSFDAVGPMATTADDASLMAEVLWTRSPGLAGPPAILDATVEFSPLRIAYMIEGWPLTPIPAILDAVQLAANALRNLGHRLVPVIVDEFRSCADTFTNAMLPESLEVHRRMGLWPERHAEYGADVSVRLRAAEAITLEVHLGALADRRILRERMNEFFRSFDILLTPTTAITAPTIENRDTPEYDGRLYPLRDLLFPFQVTAPLCGLPALALPIGRSSSGLPTSVMLTAAPRQDRQLLQLGSQLMKELT